MKVTAKVLAHERGEKLRVFKFKPKRGYKRRTGHRQELTRIEVTELGLGGSSGQRAKARDAAPAKRWRARQGRRCGRQSRRGQSEALAAEARSLRAKPAAAKEAPAKTENEREDRGDRDGA